MSKYLQKANLQVAEEIVSFAEESLSRHSIDPEKFWAGVGDIVSDLTPKNVALLQKRADLQSKINDYHRANPGTPDSDQYISFLREIGYIEEPVEQVSVTTTDVDPEIANLAGPQLVVPVLNARFALNAVNARWGSLYDALYGTDAIAQQGDLAPGSSYNPKRGAEVIAWGRTFLDDAAPLQTGNHKDSVSYTVADENLSIKLSNGDTTKLADPAAFIGFTGPVESPSSVLLRHNGLHFEILINPEGNIGKTDAAGVQDIILESALTTIMDLEDSIVAVDAEDKALGYRNWRGLMDGSLTESVTKDGRTFTRSMNPDKTFTAPDGSDIILPGRSVLFVRNVGHLMTNPMILDSEGNEVFEGLIDAVMTTLGALDDKGINSKTGSIYIVKPKMHGSEEVQLAVELFTRVEELLDLNPNTLKIGIMDEERRTSANLGNCINAAKDRVVFINTGFLDRTGDEIHTSMLAGPFQPKAGIRNQPWLSTYEARNVGIGLECGLDGVAQIGKGMWAMPDLMHDMLEQKIAHVRSGASTAWVPSPTAATLHAVHYHRVDAFAQRKPAEFIRDEESLRQLLTVSLADPSELTGDVVQTELENNVQSILGYVVRWIDQGIGCSKVPDINNVALMEDRATLRISSQLLANWLMHGVITPEKVEEALVKLSQVVDQQNAGDSLYISLIPGGKPSVAYEAAKRLILEGHEQPSGYTEPILHELRRRVKAS